MSLSSEAASLRREGKPDVPCPCGRENMMAKADDPHSGVCAQCCADAAQAFWDFCDGTISEAAFYRRLRRTSRRKRPRPG